MSVEPENGRERERKRKVIKMMEISAKETAIKRAP